MKSTEFALLIVIAIFGSACSGQSSPAIGAPTNPDDGSNGGTSDGTKGGDNAGDDSPSGSDQNITPQVSFNLGGAVSLIVDENVSSATGTSASAFKAERGTTDGSAGGSASGSGTANNGTVPPTTKPADGTTAAGTVSTCTDPYAYSGNDSQSVANLLAVDADGNTTPVITTDLPLKVMYTVVNPAGTHLYIALDPGWLAWTPTQTTIAYDFTRFIARENCALLQVTIATGERSCAAEGLFVRPMNDDYMKAISGNQKPIQFDAAGNLYFAANPFTRQENSYQCCTGIDATTQQPTCQTISSYWLGGGTSWGTGQIYKVSADTENGGVTGEVEILTQDTESVDFFVVLSSGELVFQSRGSTVGGMSTGTAALKLLQGVQMIDLTSSGGWGVDFFTVDDRNTVIFGQADMGTNLGSNGLRFARPRSQGGVEKASLDTSLFRTSTRTGWANPKPRRLLVSDNGRIYGVFEGSRDTYNDAGTWLSSSPTLTVYQLLPYEAVPKLELALRGNDWWQWMQNTPFQVAGNYLYYKDTVEVPFLGTADVIIMINLVDNTPTTLLDPNADNAPGRFEIYNWRLANGVLHFSGLNKATNKVVNGTIDAQATTCPSDPTYTEGPCLTLKQEASASGAITNVKDIEVLQADPEPDDDGLAPTATVFSDADNRYSMSIDFSKAMDRDSVEANTKITSSLTSQHYLNTDALAIMKVWIHNTLHLIPDLDVQGLANSDGTTPMSYGRTYTLNITTSAHDTYAHPFASAVTQAVTIRPASGWYISATGTNGILKYAGPADTTAYMKESFDLGAVPDNFSITFDAKNQGYNGLDILLFSTTGNAMDVYNNTHINFSIGQSSNLSYKNSDSDPWHTNWANGQTPTLFNGNWKTYRLRVYGSNLEFATKAQGESEFTVVSTFSKDDLAARDPQKPYHIIMRVLEALSLDNLQIEELDGSGNTTTSVLPLPNYNFGALSGVMIPPEFSTNVTSVYGFTY